MTCTQLIVVVSGRDHRLDPHGLILGSNSVHHEPKKVLALPECHVAQPIPCSFPAQCSGHVKLPVIFHLCDNEELLAVLIGRPLILL